MRLEEARSKCLAVQKYVFAAVHGGREVNSFSVEKENWMMTRKDGSTGICDINYHSTMPNGFLDIWYPDEDHTKKRPTIVNFHGGGMLFGSKVEGDPLAVKFASETDYMGMLLKEEFNFVSADYAFAPDYCFPSQIIQVNEVFKFLKEHEQEYGLDMSRVVLTGGSAGADFTAIYALAAAEPEYAKKLGIEPVMTMDEIKCVVINEACTLAKSIASDDNMLAMLQNWMGVENYEENELVKLAEVSSQIKGVYPPAYLIGSNAEPFFEEDACAMEAALTKYNLACKHFYRPQEVEILPHGFVGNFETSPGAKACLNEIIEFINKYAK